MAGNWLRRGVLAAAGAAALALAGCGSSTTDSELKPTRVIVFGDAFADLGQRGSRYTVNGGSVTVWTEQVALSFGSALTNSSAGGTSYATGSARVAAKPDAAGNATTPSVEEQVNAFLAANTLTANDLVLISAGTGDVITQAAAAIAGTQTSAQAIANAGTAGRALGAAVRRLVNAGAKQVAVAGTYDLSRSPWALQTRQATLLNQVSSKFNDDMLVSIVDLGSTVLYLDAALHFNLATGTPGVYGLNNATEAACASVDAGPGIGTGSGQVNSFLCNNNTLVAGIDATRFMFADRVYPTPQGHRLFGDYAYTRIRQRW